MQLKNKDLIFKLKPKLIKEFREPLGKIVKGKEELKKELKKLTPHRKNLSAGLKYKKLICIGDFSSLIVREAGFIPDISIIDGKIKRKKIEKKLLNKIQAPIVLKANNPPGGITRGAWEKVKLSFCYTLPVKIAISGEEDLLFSPACFFTPLSSIIVYGIFDKGVIVKVDKKIKEKIKEYLGLKKLNEVIAGGTFDRFHAGHKFFLLSGLEKAKKLLIGITSKKYCDRYKREASPFQERLKKLKEFLSEFGFDYKLFKIDDPFGKAIEKGQAIIVSKETEKRAKKINQLRKKRGIEKLKIIKIKTILAKDGRKISSSRIRKKKIDENGFILNKNL